MQFSQMSWFKPMCAAVFAVGLGLGMTGCDETEDAFEDAGDNIEDAVDDVEDAVD